MKIVATSDWHGEIPAIPSGDVLVIAGDILPLKIDRSFYKSAKWLEDVLYPQLVTWLEDDFIREIIAIPGNHDFFFQENKGSPDYLPWTFLVDQEYEFEGVKFYGLPWVPRLSGWAYYADEYTLDIKYQFVPEDTDVVISHGPPVGHRVDDVGYTHAGAFEANDMMKRVMPKIFICGHIHEGYTDWKYEPIHLTDVYNVSHMDVNYNPVNPPVLIHYDPPIQGEPDVQIPPEL